MYPGQGQKTDPYKFMTSHKRILHVQTFNFRPASCKYSSAEDKNRKQEQARRDCENQDKQPGERQRDERRALRKERKNTAVRPRMDTD